MAARASSNVLIDYRSKVSMAVPEPGSNLTTWLYSKPAYTILHVPQLKVQKYSHG